MRRASGSWKLALTILRLPGSIAAISPGRLPPEFGRDTARRECIEDLVDRFAIELLELEGDLRLTALGDLGDGPIAARGEAFDLRERDVVVGGGAVVLDAEPALAVIEHLVGALEHAADVRADLQVEAPHRLLVQH